MRIAFLSLAAGVALMVFALCLLEIEGEHIYSPGGSRLYNLIAATGMFLLFAAFLIFVIASSYLAAKLRPGSAVFGGLALLTVAVTLWSLLSGHFGMDNWRMFLAFPPLIVFFSSFLVIVVGAFRLIGTKIRRSAAP